jgi:hypothetical protein
LQQRRQLKTDFCEILGAAQFSTFSTASVKMRRSTYCVGTAVLPQ